MPPETRSAVVIEDDDDLRLLLIRILNANGFETTGAANGADGLAEVTARDPDLITLDLGLPDTDGLVLCRGLRRASDAYIIIVTARRQESDLLVGLEIGADDFLTKPFSILEFSARIEALLRRPRKLDRGYPVATPGDTVHLIDGLVVNESARTVHLNDQELSLTKTEFELLAVLAHDAGRVWPRAELLAEVWGSTWAGDDHLVDVHMGNLRRKLDRAESPTVRVDTVRSVGYRLRRVTGVGT